MTEYTKKKFKCTECRHVCDVDELLQGSNPFDAEIPVYGCPVCKSVDRAEACCDVVGCKAWVTCGTPTPDGYRNTCSKHKPDKEVTP